MLNHNYTTNREMLSSAPSIRMPWTYPVLLFSSKPLILIIPDLQQKPKFAETAKVACVPH